MTATTVAVSSLAGLDAWARANGYTKRRGIWQNADHYLTLAPVVDEASAVQTVVLGGRTRQVVTPSGWRVERRAFGSGALIAG